MRVGFIGLGKLGYPVALAMSMNGNDVVGYDIDAGNMTKEPRRYLEVGPDGNGSINDYINNSNMLKFGNLEDIAKHSEIVFVAVQTPHSNEFEGVTRLPNVSKDFDYSYLKNAISNLSDVVDRPTPIVVISTVLPGTMTREIKPLMNEFMHLIYNPFFIAMGTTMRDFLNPEFILIGVDDIDSESTGVVCKFYDRLMPNSQIKLMSIESAELTKVSYNTFISMKIAFANTIMEICDKTGCANVDDVTDALKCANDRLISPAYMSGGMGDGGGCHPRDNIAMSWLADNLCLTHDIFRDIMLCREHHAEYLAKKAVKFACENKCEIVILGYSFKPETNIIVGSPAILVANIIRETGIEPLMMDNSVVVGSEDISKKCVYLIGCRHRRFINYDFPVGSVVIDPFRIIPEIDGVTVYRIGE